MTDTTTHQCKDCGTAFDQAAQKDWSPAGTCSPCWDAFLTEINKHGKFINASKYYEEQKDAEIERLRAGIAYIQMRLNDLPHINDENHICITCQALDKCDELLKGGE